jgi:6-phosphogluconolactonase (cycloisomerase 2 family)
MNVRAAFTALGIIAAAFGQTQTSAHAAQLSKSSKVALYAAVGPELTHYEVDVDNATLIKRASVTLPDSVQYAWPHPSRHYLYVGWSNGSGADHHGVSAFSIDPLSGALHALGAPVTLPARPVHVTVDIPGTHLLVAYNDPSGLTVHSLAPDGAILSQVREPASLDWGIYGHQVRVDPSNKIVILVTRGNGPAGGKPEDPGALKVFGYKDGILANRASIAPNKGYGFQPRHLDFHPSGPWVFVSLERQNKLQVYKKLADGTLSSEPLFTKDSLTRPGKDLHGQAAGTVHVHPNGRFVYQANRAGGTVEFAGKRVFAGGENAIAVYAINQDTGEPTLIQNFDARGMEPRTFALDANARILVAANQNAMLARDGNNVITVPSSLAVFRVRGDGKLDFVRKYDVKTDHAGNLFWMGLVSLP